MCLNCKDIVPQSCAMVPKRWIFGIFLGPGFPASCVQHIWDLHYKFHARATPGVEVSLSLSSQFVVQERLRPVDDFSWLKLVLLLPSVLWHCWLGGRKGIRPVKNMGGGWWRWAPASPDGVAPSRMVGVSASVNLPLHHKVQKFSSGTGLPG